MDTLRICKQCQKPLPQNAPEGLCPECLARVALGSEPATPGSRVPPEPADLAAQFPQLEILELLGVGGMGIVYKARQPRLDRMVALKILPVESARDASFTERFEREARALARLNHPGIVAVYDFGQTKDFYYFVMEYVNGMNLRQLIQAKTLESRQALELVTQICTALQFAHDEKIVHRDIKPENILITKKGQVKIADFGLAKLLGSQPDTALTASQMMMGTLNYMAPEQRENTKDVDHRADIYSLGVVFYEMLTGEVPMGRFDAPSKKVQIDVRLDEVVLHALEREPARRYQQVSEVKSNVETITSSMPREMPKASPLNATTPSESEQKMFSEKPIAMKHWAWGWLVTGGLIAGVWITISCLNLSPVFNLIVGVLAVSAWVGLIYRQRVSDLRKINSRAARGLLIQKFLMLAIAASVLVWCATLTEVFIAWLHRHTGSRAGNHDDVAVFLLLAAFFAWVVFEMVKLNKLWPSVAPQKPQPAATPSPSAPAPMPEAGKVFSRSDAISIAKFILAIFICYVVGCFVPFAGLLMFCAVLLVGARQLSAQIKKASVPLSAMPPPADSTPQKTTIFWLCAYGVFCLGWLVTKMLWNFREPGCWLASFGMAALVMCVSWITVKHLRLFPAEFSLKKAMPIYLRVLVPIFLILILGFVFLIGGFFNLWEQNWWHGNLQAQTPQQFEAANKGTEYKLIRNLAAFSNDIPNVEMNYGKVQRHQTGLADASIPFMGVFPGWESHGPRQDPDTSLLNLAEGCFLLVWLPICVICGWRGPGTKPFRAPWRNVLAGLGVSACVLGSVLPIYIVCHLGDSYTSQGRDFFSKAKMDAVADTIQKWALQNGYAVGDEVEWDIDTVPKGNRVAKVSIREAWKPSPFDRWQATWTSFHRVSPYIAFELVSTENPDQTIINVSSVKEIPEDLISVLDKM